MPNGCTCPASAPARPPAQLLQKYVNDEKLTQMAMERVINDTYQQAIRETGVHPYANADPKFDLPDEDVKPEEGFSYSVTLALEPHVHLGEMDGLTGRKLTTVVTDEEVEREIDGAREQLAHFHESEEAAATGDRVRLTAQITMDGEPVDEASIDEPTLVLIGANFKTFDEALEGIKPGEDKTFQFTYPDDFADEELRGKAATAEVKVSEVHKRHVYDADDDFAQRVGSESLEALRTSVREALQRQADAMSERDLTDSLVAEIVRRSTVHYPTELLDHEAAGQLNNLLVGLETRKLSLDDYLRARNSDLPSLELALRSESKERVERTLVMLNVARENGLSVSEKDVEAEIKVRAEAEGVKPSQMRRYLNDNDELQTLRDTLFYRKVAEFLRSKAEIREVTA